MNNAQKPAFFTLLMMISFASINAVLFTPALPDIARFFQVSNDTAQLTIIWFLVGYAFGQLLYGPLCHHLGRKNALYGGIGLQIIASLICILAGYYHTFSLLIIGRLLLALGSGVGLKMTFTLVNECYTPQIASQKTAYLVLSFAITPALAVALGGVLTVHLGWESCFYAGILYGCALLYAVYRLPNEPSHTPQRFNVNALANNYAKQFSNKRLLAGACLMGSCTAFVYGFAAFAPFIAINLLGMDSAEYGFMNLLSSIGLILGSLSAAQLVTRLRLTTIIRLGLSVTLLGVIMMLALIKLNISAYYAVFLPMAVINYGLSLLIANASTLALSETEDKAHGSAVMNFINMGTALLAVLLLGYLPLSALVLPYLYLILCVIMFSIYHFGLAKTIQI